MILASFSVSLGQTSPFPTPIANPFEARIGSMVQFGERKLRLDIGVPVTLGEPVHSDSDGWLRYGAELMTWTRLRSEGNFKFPVETIDYWFGLYASFKLMPIGIESRLRVAHISSHLVDGLADTGGTLSRKPFVYSREFAELLFGYTAGWFRPYAGATAIWATQPDNPNPFVPQVGLDIQIPLSARWAFRGGYDVKLIGIDGTYAASNAAQAGVFYAMMDGRGILINLYGYSGRSMHGMFYTSGDQYLAAGFQLIL
ncbi:MAG: hypothetical protein HYX66_00880 [Ignavibacteria bacterium]|nr:hypothetical protein [Ignavibacteria bacterium]